MLHEDDIIKTKLLIEGDGGNDDRRIGTLLRMFVKWAKSTEADAESDATCSKMLAMLAQCESAALKSSKVYEMNLVEQEHYEQLNDKIEEDIAAAHKEIEECKAKLQTARYVRKNRQEYDALAKVIEEQPDRQKSLNELQNLAKDIEALRTTNNALDNNLELKKKQFHAFLVTCNSLQKSLEEDEEGPSETTGSAMDTTSSMSNPT